MTQAHEIESFRLVKAGRRLLRPSTESLERVALDNNCSDELRLEAILNLGKIADPESLQILTRSLANFNDCVEPITALGYFKNSSTVSGLLEKLEDPDEHFKEEIVKVLGEIGDPMATRALLEYLHDEDRMVRYYAARALYKMGGRDVVQSLCGLLNDPDEWIVINVLEILANLRDPEAIPALVGQFEVARDSRLKAIIISSLSVFAEGRLLKTFESGLESFDPRIQANSVEAISMLKIPALEMKRKLKRFYGHPNNRVRANLCIALARADEAAVIDELQDMLESKDTSTRRSAAYVLARIEMAGREEKICILLQDENFGVRKMALKAALELPGIGSQREIRPLLKDDNQWVRKEAVECAMRIDDFPDDDILDMFKVEESAPVIECLLQYIVKNDLKSAVEDIFNRIKKEPEEEMPWLISALGHLGAREELLKVKKFLGAVRSEVLAEYYQALLLNGELSVIAEMNNAFVEKKRDQDLLNWVKIAGSIGNFLQRVELYSRSLFDALAFEVKKDMEGLEVFDLNEELTPEITHEQGIDCFNKRDFIRAGEIFSNLLKQNPDDSLAAYHLGNTLYNTGDISRAIKTLSGLLRAKPDAVEAAVLLGQIHFRRKDWQSLIDCYEKAVKFVKVEDKKNRIRIFGALGLAYYHKQQYEKAIEALSTGLKANPRDLSASYHLALCYYAMGNAEKARHILQGLRKTLPPDSQVLKNVIELLQRI